MTYCNNGLLMTHDYTHNLLCDFSLLFRSELSPALSSVSASTCTVGWEPVEKKNKCTSAPLN